MSELLFTIKSLALTILVVVLFQVKVGETTLEQKTMVWIESSPLIAPVQDVVQGGVKVVERGVRKLTSAFGSKFNKAIDKGQLPGHRNLGITLERSEEYLRSQAKSIKKAAKEKTSEIFEDPLATPYPEYKDSNE